MYMDIVTFGYCDTFQSPECHSNCCSCRLCDNIQLCITVQDDHSACSKPPVDIDLKVVFKYKFLILNANFKSMSMGGFKQAEWSPCTCLVPRQRCDDVEDDLVALLGHDGVAVHAAGTPLPGNQGPYSIESCREFLRHWGIYRLAIQLVQNLPLTLI